jgi:hypothetical protein
MADSPFFLDKLPSQVLPDSTQAFRTKRRGGQATQLVRARPAARGLGMDEAATPHLGNGVGTF